MTSTDQYTTFPNGRPEGLKDFKVEIPQKSLETLQSFLAIAELPKPTYESLMPDHLLGISHEWMSKAKDEWQHHFDWRKHEAYMNSFAHFKAPIKDDDGKMYDIHFIGIFSQKQDAIPVILCHGWPGSFIEFLPMLDLLRNKYPASELPYHLIVPSLPGYTFSSPPPLDKDFKVQDVARLFNRLMINLGFGAGYVVQGGDIGSMVARVMAVEHESCKAIHINFCIMDKPANPIGELSEVERKGLERSSGLFSLGTSYGLQHATKPSTTAFVLYSSPIALLAWIGEKFLAWTDEDPALDLVLESVTLYWVTRCIPTTIYPYRQILTPGSSSIHQNPKWHISASQAKFGYSFFPKELLPIPRSWACTTGDLIWHRQHESGGHFAALEKPQVLLEDLEEFIAEVW